MADTMTYTFDPDIAPGWAMVNRCNWLAIFVSDCDIGSGFADVLRIILPLLSARVGVACR